VGKRFVGLPPRDRSIYDELSEKARWVAVRYSRNVPVIHWRDGCIFQHGFPGDVKVEATESFQDRFCNKRVRMSTDLIAI
jgi:hypothetical protein